MSQPSPTDGQAALGEIAPSKNGDQTGARRRMAKPDDLAGAIKRVMAARGLATRDVVRRVPRRHVGTVYRLLAGRTTDPWASTLVSLCAALEADPDELLDVADLTADLGPELRRMLEDVRRLPDEDRWLVLDLLRAFLSRRRAAPTP